MIVFGPGDCSPIIEACKRLLGVFPVDEFFSDALAQRIRGVQLMAGVEKHGLIDEDLLDRLGVCRD